MLHLISMSVNGMETGSETQKSNYIKFLYYWKKDFKKLILQTLAREGLILLLKYNLAVTYCPTDWLTVSLKKQSQLI